VAVVLERQNGDRLRLGCMAGGAFVPSFHVSGWSDTSDVPGTVYPGYDGEEVDERAVRVSARSYTVRGWLRADTPAELERLVDQLQGWVNTKEELRLQRSETDDKFVLVRKVSFAHDYVFKTGHRQCNVSITFKASDPYRYGPPIVLSRNLYGDGLFGTAFYGDLPDGEWYAANRGTVATRPRLTITAGTAILGLVLRNKDTDEVLTIGDLDEGDVVEIDCERIVATINGDIATHRMGDRFLVYGFTLQALSPNHLVAETENATGPFVGLQIEARERYY
jgi:phage-related protein